MKRKDRTAVSVRPAAFAAGIVLLGGAMGAQAFPVRAPSLHELMYDIVQSDLRNQGTVNVSTSRTSAEFPIRQGHGRISGVIAAT